VVDIFASCLFVVVVFPPRALAAKLLAAFPPRVTLLSPMMRKQALFLLAFFSVLAPRAGTQQAGSERRPCVARQPSVAAFGEKLEIAGIPNAGKINEVLYRGAQPRKPGFAELQKLGITTIVDLRREDADKIAWEHREVEQLGLRFVPIPVGGWATPSEEQVAQFLALFRDDPKQKVFVHCRFGDDRTGVFVASYRMAVDKWNEEQALKEMYFFGFHGFWHPAMKTFIREFPTRLKDSPALGPYKEKQRSSHRNGNRSIFPSPLASVSLFKCED